MEYKKRIYEPCNENKVVPIMVYIVFLGYRKAISFTDSFLMKVTSVGIICENKEDFVRVS